MTASLLLSSYRNLTRKKQNARSWLAFPLWLCQRVAGPISNEIDVHRRYHFLAHQPQSAQLRRLAAVWSGIRGQNNDGREKLDENGQAGEETSRQAVKIIVTLLRHPLIFWVKFSIIAEAGAPDICQKIWHGTASIGDTPSVGNSEEIKKDRMLESDLQLLCHSLFQSACPSFHSTI